jgi:hypothetical protein
MTVDEIIDRAMTIAVLPGWLLSVGGWAFWVAAHAATNAVKGNAR